MTSPNIPSENESVPPDGLQHTIFDAGLVPDVRSAPQEEEIIWTKDLTSLADVPVSSEKNIRMLQRTLVGPEGSEITVETPGKVIMRRAPHPEYVKLQGDVVHREKLTDKTRSLATPIMVDQVTTVLYSNGVVTPFHMDVFHALLHMALDRWQRGLAVDRITTTRSEVLKVISSVKNGKSVNGINDALKTLSGLSISKDFDPLGKDAPGLRSAYHLGGIIANYEIHERAATNARGAPDLIVVEFNPQIIKALKFGSDQVHWSLRTLNLTKTIKITENWKRQFYRLLDSRFQQTGQLLIPARELWIGCLGNDERDAITSDRWRQARFRLRTALDEFVQSGYISRYEFQSRALPRKKKVGMEDEPTKLTVKMGSEKVDVVASATYTLDEESEWILAIPGPAFFAEGPKRARDFAADVVAALLGVPRAGRQVPKPSPETAEGIVAVLGDQAVLGDTSDRMKAAILEVGDLYRRMPQTEWLSESYPMAPLNFLVSLFHTDYEQQVSARVLGDGARGPNPRYWASRMALVSQGIPRFLASRGTDLAKVIDGFHREENDGDSSPAPSVAVMPVYFEKGKVSLEEITTTTHLMTEILLRRRQCDGRLRNRHVRTGDPALASDFASLRTTVAAVATQALGVLVWQGVMSERVAQDLKAIGTTDPYAAAWARNHLSCREYARDARRLIDEWSGYRTSGGPLEQLRQAIVNRLRRRLVEHAIEADQLSKSTGRS